METENVPTSLRPRPPIPRATPAMLRAFRSEFGLTQADLVRDLGVTGQAVSRWERNAQNIRHPQMLYLALQRLRCMYHRRARQARLSKVAPRAAA